jgi:uncharacterized protein (TIGR03435 family)
MAVIQRDTKCPVYRIAILAVALAAVSGPLGAQRTRLIAQHQPDRPQLAFEVAILKPNTNSGVGVTGGCRGIDSKFGANDPRAMVPVGRCVVRAGALRHLMTIAFDLPLDRISGLPEWDRSNRFDVEAKAEDPSTTSEAQLLAMLQQLLTDEFSLTVHRERKEGPTFSLVVARNGPRNLHASDDTGCLASSARVAGFALKGCTMQDLASLLSSMPPVQRPVVDKTALTGRFDFVVEVGSKAGNVAELKAALAQWETLFSDLQEQLGLRLERSTGSVETLVIDRAELPREK